MGNVFSWFKHVMGIGRWEKPKTDAVIEKLIAKTRGPSVDQKTADYNKMLKHRRERVKFARRTRKINIALEKQ